jgi:hypothetical protein
VNPSHFGNARYHDLRPQRISTWSRAGWRSRAGRSQTVGVVSSTRILTLCSYTRHFPKDFPKNFPTAFSSSSSSPLGHNLENRGVGRPGASPPEISVKPFRSGPSARELISAAGELAGLHTEPRRRRTLDGHEREAKAPGA